MWGDAGTAAQAGLLRAIDEEMSRRGGLLTIEEAESVVIRHHWLMQLAREGLIFRVARGLYSSEEHAVDPHDAAIISQRGSVVCLSSALDLHGIITRQTKSWYGEEPRIAFLALPSGATRVVAGTLPAVFVRMSGASLGHGVIRMQVAGREVYVFSLEKTLADCFKFRRLVGEERANAAFEQAVREDRVDPAALAEAARVCRVTKRFAAYLGRSVSQTRPAHGAP